MSAARRFALGFGLVYFGLYCLPFPFGSRTTIAQWYTDALDPFLQWLGELVGIEGPLSMMDNGSGDRPGNYLITGFFAAVALVGGVVLSRLRQNRDWEEALRIWLRYFLGATLVAYGMIKVIPLQFPLPDPSRLLQTYGESSPMRLLWTFMGESSAYTRLGGLAEVAAGLLLFFRRTTALGALIAAGVMLNVAALNFSYDVCVKLFSAHLVLIALVLLLPDLRRLFDLFVRNRGADPADLTPPRFLAERPRLHRILKALVLVGILGAIAVETVGDLVTRGDGTPRVPDYGAYEVVEMHGGSPWRNLAIGNRRTTVVFADGRRGLFGVTGDHWELEGIPIGTLRRTRTDGELRLEGELMGSAISVRLRPLPEGKQQLRTRGFHWVNDSPFNH